MRRPHENRSRARALLAMACGLLAILALPSFAAAKDHNHDRIPDRWEKRHHLSLNVNQGARDQDRDQLDNRGEFRAGDDPRDNDSDDDGVMDGNENAGTISSFDPATGKLVITLYGGDTVSGLVTDETRIQCGHECNRGDEGESDDSGASISRGGPGDNSGGEPGDNSGPGSGPDQIPEPGEDPPGHDGTPPGASEGPGRGDEHTANCTTAALVVGAVVDEAELELEHGVATFEKVELEQ